LYRRGVTLEREVIRLLSLWGWKAMRSAGSHGMADVVAIRPDGLVWLIQCKSMRMLPGRKRLRTLWGKYFGDAGIRWHERLWAVLITRSRGRESRVSLVLSDGRNLRFLMAFKGLRNLLGEVANAGAGGTFESEVERSGQEAG
jgi:hypothetical protein